MIRGFFTQRIPQPLVQVAVEIPGKVGIPEPVLFVIDTGAARTCIHARDAQVLLGYEPEQLDPETWPKDRTEQLGGVTGAARYLLVPANLSFPPR